ncbi:MAG: hypothetical protein VCC02_09480 [Myxococcota bacterium]
MKPSGTYKLFHRRSNATRADDPIDEYAPGESRARRIVDSLRAELSTGDASDLRIRQIFDVPQPIYRLEYDLAGLNAQRVTLLDRDSLEDLLETEAVRNALPEDLA